MRKHPGYTHGCRTGELSIRQRLETVCDELDVLAVQEQDVSHMMSVLEAKPMYDAQPYWMRKNDPDGKPDQLELTHSTKGDYYRQNGRRRQYIGTDPEKIGAALDAIQRYRKHRKLSEALKSIREKRQSIEGQIRSLEYVTFGKQRRLWGRNGADRLRAGL